MKQAKSEKPRRADLLGLSSSEVPGLDATFEANKSVKMKRRPKGMDFLEAIVLAHRHISRVWYYI